LMTDLYHVPNRVTHTFQRGAVKKGVKAKHFTDSQFLRDDV